MKRLCGILLALAGLFLYAPCAAQNTRVRGTVTDAQTGEPIPYAVVLFPGTTTGITTDDEGFYSLESRDTSSYIRAEMVSYEPQIRPVHVGGYNQIDFRLTPSHLEIESVVITPGDNPAHPILEGIIRNKKYNDSKEYDRYICRTYTKMELGLANIREFRSKKLQQNFGFIFEHLDTSSVTGQPYLPVMISETAADYYHSRTPSVAREVIRASQISGIEDNSVLAQFTGHLHADVNLYENFIDLFGVKFASPLSNSGRSFYKYFLVDSTNVEGRKTYKIRFHPKSVATPVLDGEVNIDSASYALRSARVKMAKGVNVNWIRHLAIEADNRLTADSLWFPQREKMTADFTLTKSDSSKMIAFLGSREVTYSDVKFDTPIPKQVLGTSASVILSDDAISGKQVEWDSLRPYTLTQKEKAIYQMVDSIQQVPLYKNIYTVLNTIIGGYYNTKYVGIGPYGCENLTRVTFPEGLTAIGQNCFRNCAKLESIELPSSVRTLDIYAFYGCKLLTSVVIPEGVEAIPRFLFDSCTALTDVTLPSTLKSIGAEAFEATGLEEITIPESVTTIESSVFKNCKSLERIQFPDALTAIPANLCNACSALTTINMPSKLETVGNDAFYNCGKLQDVTFPETLKSLDERSFGGCSAFTRIIIDIPAIANYAFWNCANVTSIDLGEKVTSIGRNAFISASNLQTITCRAENAPSLGNSAFGSAGSKVEGAKILYVPAASYDAYETAWTDVTSQGYALQDINDQQLTDGIYYRASREADWVPTLPATFTALYVRTVGDNAALTASQFNTVITKISAQSAPVTLDLNMAKFEATEFPTGLAGNAKLGTIKFFENTASIAAGAFKGCTALTKATVPTGVEIIGESTFEGCTALASLTLPSSVKTVGDKAFKGCSALVETSLSAIENIGTEAFAGTGLTSAKIYATTLGEKSFRDCTELTAITLGSATTIPAEMFAGCTAITTVTIPASVQTIGASAFEGCSKLATLTLGSGVTTLGDRAFADCGLTALALPDNVTTLGDGAFSNNPNIATLQFGAGLTAISDNAFATNDAIENLTIPKTIVTIGAGSFSDWSKLTKLTISGNTLTSIGSKAFENAALLADVYAEPTTAPAVQADSFSGAGTSVQGSKTFHVASVEAYSSWTTAASGYTMEALGPDYLSEGLYYRASGEDPWKSEIPQTFTTLYVKTVGDNTVMTAAQMKSVADAVLALAAPATVDFSEVVYESTTFPNSFKSNANLAGIVFPQNVTATASAAFQKTGMTSVTVLKDISYGSNAFDSCASLVSVTVEEGVTEIGNYMFQNTKLTDVTLPNSVTKIGASAFNGCSLTTINFGQGVKTIENSAFQNCGELTEIILPDATETLGQNAFGDCPKLAKISLGKNMKTLEAYCFVGYSKGCPLLGDIICRATTPPTLKDDYGTGPFGGGWSPVAGKDVPAENRIIHLPKSADLVGGTGAYADSSWVKLTSSTYGFAFKYDVEG